MQVKTNPISKLRQQPKRGRLDSASKNRTGVNISKQKHQLDMACLRIENTTNWHCVGEGQEPKYTRIQLHRIINQRSYEAYQVWQAMNSKKPLDSWQSRDLGDGSLHELVLSYSNFLLSVEVCHSLCVCNTVFTQLFCNCVSFLQDAYSNLRLSMTVPPNSTYVILTFHECYNKVIHRWYHWSPTQHTFYIQM